MRTLLAAVLIGLFAALAVAELPENFGTNHNGGLYFTDRFMVTVKPGADALKINYTINGKAVTGNAGLDYLCERNGVISVEPYYQYPVRNDLLRSLVERMYVFYLEPGKDAININETFLNSDVVEFSDLWTIAVQYYMPNDPAISQQWALDRIEAFGAWDIVRGDTTASVVIAIDDSGIYYNHPDLQANMWINGPEDLNQNGLFDDFPESEGGDINNQDEDGNGYPDDVVGWDFGYVDNDPAEDVPTHGTHVAGCASEVTDNNTGGAGPGFSAKLMAVKATNTPGYITHGYPAMIYAADNGANIINCSWGGTYYSSGEQNICNYAYSTGILIVAAAGNDDPWIPPYVNYPSAYNNVFAVASTSPTDHKSGFSNYGTWVDISAPGQNIYSTWATSSYMTLNGTSMASPVVAGVAALVMAQNPGHSPDQVGNILMASADTIDHLNPQFAGMLGAGRVNAQMAVSMNSPIIHLLDFETSITSGDNDDVINPGESIELGITLENVNIDAFNVVGTLRVPEGVTVTDSVSEFGSIPGGEQSDNYSDPFALTFGSDLVPGDFNLIVNITADGGYNVDLGLTIDLSLSQSNFPISLPDAISSDPLVWDLDADGSSEIIIGCNDSKLYVIENDGTYMSGWPATLTDDVNNAPAIGDIDNDGSFEVVAVSKDGAIYAWDYNGIPLNNFPVETGGSVFASPTLADLDGNGDLEIIQPNFQTNNIDIINHDGSVFGNWPYEGTVAWYGSAAIGDIDGDEQIEIAIAGFDNYLHVFNPDKTEVPGFPIELDHRVWVSPVIGDIDPSDLELEIFVPTQTGSAYLFNHDGTPVSGWPINIGTAIKSPPSLGDFDDDGSPEIVFGANNSNVYVYDSDATLLEGFPVSLISTIMVSAVIADITGNGTPDILIANGSAETYLFGFDSQGQTLPNFPIPTSAIGSVTASPAVWNIDHDSDLEIVVGVQNDGDNLDVFDYKASSSLINAHWPFYGRDIYRSSNFEGYGPVSVDDDMKTLPLEFGLNQNYPNPFNNHTNISFNLDTPSKYSLEVYDILGRRVRMLDSGFKQAGVYSVSWNGQNNNAEGVASGVYFYRLKAGEKIAVKRMLYLK